MKEYTVKVYDDRTLWYLNDKLHREDEPAVEWNNGNKEWFLNGKRHREDGPAVEFVHGSKYWFLNDKRHREDGPAIEFANGSKSWWLNGKKLTEAKFNAKMNPVELTLDEIASKFGISVSQLKIRK